MADFEYSITPIPLSVAGEQVIDQEGDFWCFLSALDASGQASLDAKLQVAFGRTTDDFAFAFPNSDAEGYFDKVRVKWAAQAGLTAYLYISRSPILKLRTPPAKQLVTSAIATTFAHGAVTVGTAAVLIRAANSNRQSLIVQNLGTVDIFVGGVGVTTGNGLRVQAGQASTLDKSTAAVYGISGTAGQDVRYFEEG